nr:hypothetical protein CFP56_02641 [Quercus suber]
MGPKLWPTCRPRLSGPKPMSACGRAIGRVALHRVGEATAAIAAATHQCCRGLHDHTSARQHRSRLSNCSFRQQVM